MTRQSACPASSSGSCAATKKRQLREFRAAVASTAQTRRGTDLLGERGVEVVGYRRAVLRRVDPFAHERPEPSGGGGHRLGIAGLGWRHGDDAVRGGPRRGIETAKLRIGTGGEAPGRAQAQVLPLDRRRGLDARRSCCGARWPGDRPPEGHRVAQHARLRHPARPGPPPPLRSGRAQGTCYAQVRGRAPLGHCFALVDHGADECVFRGCVLGAPARAGARPCHLPVQPLVASRGATKQAHSARVTQDQLSHHVTGGGAARYTAEAVDTLAARIDRRSPWHE